MCERNHDNLAFSFAHYDVVRKALQDKPFGAMLPRDTLDGRKRNDVIFEEIERRLHCTLELGTESWPLRLIPRSSLGGFFRCRCKDAQHARHFSLMRARMRRRNSSRSISVAVPDSTSATLRRISVSHASAASASTGASRLFISSCASSARSRSGSCNASDRSFSKVVLLIYYPF